MEHLLHARATGRAFIANDYHVARLNFLVQDYRYGLFLGFDHTGRSREGPQFFFHARCLHDGTVWSQVSAQDNEAAVGRKGMIGVMNAAISGVSIELVPAVGLGKWFGGAHAAGGGEIKLTGLIGGVRVADIPIIEPLLGVIVQRRMHLQVQVPGAAKFSQDGGDAAGAVDILNVVGAIGRDLGQAGHAVGDVINVIEGEIHLAFLCGCKRVQDGVGGSAHGHV